jgi:cytosine/adenosine deaminase-related metal-dependent hydrolase
MLVTGSAHNGGGGVQPPADLCVHGGLVVALDGVNAPRTADVYVSDGKITAIGGPPRAARARLDATGMAVMPGMHNLHDHLRDLAPGSAEGLKLDDLLRQMWRLNEHAGPAEYRIGAALAGARLLKAGVTSVVDHIYPFHRPRLAEAAIEGYSQSGIRWFMARGIMSEGYTPICEPADDAFRAIEELCDGAVPREQLFVAPVSFRQTGADVYVRARRLADRLGLRLYTHIAETAAEVDALMSEHGARPVELLHSLGFCGDDTVMVHCVLLSDDEIAALADSGTHVVHCPTNHMKLAKGVTPVPALLAAGVNVCLGVDMMTDLLSEVRLEMLLQGLHASDPAVISPTTALEMATVRGARALGLERELGPLAPDHRADLVCVDLSAVPLQPVLDPVWTLANRATAADVVHVIRDGEVVVRDGALCRVDETALVAEAREVVDSYLRRAGSDLRPLAAGR